ncbi:hypothetical protein WK13_34875 [Burkholderia ubonensis]|uniref:hypothetical protein n=1 Tax=Burkholderia ubonensis TaxID=101571 RepID=UPI0007541F06|nr:hypothetical protein [Burkholderia ubonensis]KVR21725.1 hypothetical protein WK13_34875 [Burkholderia ubonensis]
MAGQAELKILISVANETAGALNQIRADIAALLRALTGADFGSAAAQFIQAAKAAHDLANEARGAGSAMRDLSASTTSAGLNLAAMFKELDDQTRVLVTDIGGAAAALRDLAKAAQDSKNAGGGPGRNARGDVDLLTASVGALTKALKFAAGGFLAFEAVKFLKDLADTAARTQVLGTVLQQVGANAGYTSQELAAADKSVQKLGITAASSRESLAQLIQAGLSINLAAPLARASQDLAVIAGWNSSETFSRLITNINQMDTVGLRWMGIIIDREQAIQHATQVVGHALDSNQQKQAFANAVLEQATRIQGIYEASMDNVGKQLTSMPRYIENLKNSLGQGLLPVYSELVKAAIAVLNALNELAASFQGSAKNAELLGLANDSTAGSYNGLAEAIKTTSQYIVDAINWLKEHKEVLVETGLILRDVAIAYTALTVIGRVTAMVSAAITAFRAAAVAIAAFQAGTAGLGALLAALGGPITIAIAVLAALATVATSVWMSSKGGADEATKSTVDAQKAIDTLKTKYSELAQQQKQNLELARQISDKQLIASDMSKPQDVRASAASDVLELKRQQADLQKQIKDTTASIKEQKESLKDADLTANQQQQISTILQGYADLTKTTMEQARAWQNFAEAAKNAGVDVALATTGMAQKFSESADVIMASQKFVKDGSEQSKNLLTAMLLEFEKLANTVSSPQELAKFQQAGDALRAMAQTAGVDISSALKGAQGQAQQHFKESQAALKAGGESALNEGRAITKARAQQAVEAAQSVAALTKIANQAALDSDQYRFQQGLIDLTAFYDKRAAVVKSNAEQEKLVVMAQMKALQISMGTAKTGSERVGYETQLIAQQNKLKQIDAQRDADLQREAIARAKEQEALDKEVAQIKFQAMQETDQKLAGAQALLAMQYAELHKKLDGIKGAKELLDAEYKRKADVLAVQQLNEETGRQANLQQSLLETKRAQIALAQSRGMLTDISAANADNALIQAEIENVEKLIEVERQASEKYKSLGMQKEFEESQQKLADYQNQVIQLASAFHTLGDSIRHNFSDALSQGIYDVLSHSKSIGEAFRGAALNFVNSINKVIADDLSQRMTKWIIDSTGGEGNSIFDSLASALGGKKGAELGSSASNAMWVRSADVTRQQFTTNGSTQGGTGLMSAVDGLFKTFAGGAGGLGGSAALGLSSFFNMGNTAANDYGFSSGGGNLDNLTTTGGSALFGLGGGDGFNTFRDSMTSGITDMFSGLGAEASAGGLGLDQIAKGFQDGAVAVGNSTANSIGGLFSSIASMFSEGGSGGGGGGMSMIGMGGGLGGAIGGLIGGKKGAGWGSMIGSALGMAAMMFLADGGLPGAAVKHYADGFGLDEFKDLDAGLISGPGTGRSDSIPAMVANNEFIMNADATKKHLPLLYALNSGSDASINARLPKSKFADGGLPGLQSIASGLDAGQGGGGGGKSGGAGSDGSRFVLVDERKRVPQAMAGADGKNVVFVHLQRDIPTLKTMLGLKNK